MRARKLSLSILFVFTSLIFAACNDESENILPEPPEKNEVSATVGNEGEPEDPMN